MKLDQLDRKILSALVADGRISWRELSERIGLSTTPTLKRVRALEQAGYIAGYSARIDEAVVGRPISVFVSVTLDRQDLSELETFEAAIARVPQIMSCFVMAGEVDYLLRVVVADVAEFERFLTQVLRPIPGMRRINSAFALKPVIQRTAPPLS